MKIEYNYKPILVKALKSFENDLGNQPFTIDSIDFDNYYKQVQIHYRTSIKDTRSKTYRYIEG